MAQGCTRLLDTIVELAEQVYSYCLHPSSCFREAANGLRSWSMALGRAWTLLGSSINSKPEKCLKMARLPSVQCIISMIVWDALLGFFLFCTAIYCKNAVLVETIHIPEPAFA